MKGALAIIPATAVFRPAVAIPLGEYTGSSEAVRRRRSPMVAVTSCVCLTNSMATSARPVGVSAASRPRAVTSIHFVCTARLL